MKRAGLWLLVAIPVVLLFVWVANNTYWADVALPIPLKGEALTNPFYATQRFAEALGSRSSWDRVFTAPPPDSVIVLSSWHWSLSRGRRDALARWVEAGGRLVIDSSVVDGEDDFERWSGIVTDYHEEEKGGGIDVSDIKTVEPDAVCGTFEEAREGSPAEQSGSTPRYRLCDFDTYAFLTTKRPTLWTLRDKNGIQAMRVAVGRGRVTVINGSPFRYRSLFDGDHARLFVAATELRRHDDVHLLSEDDHPSLLALTWQYGGAVVLLTCGFVGLALWRSGVRLGPIAAPLGTARRSLAEQIRGTGQFALRHGGGAALHAASVRALEEAAARRVPGYAGLAPDQRGAALAALTGFDRQALLTAIHHDRARQPGELRSTIALIEAARRVTLVDQKR
jgi:hypothetical protein